MDSGIHPALVELRRTMNRGGLSIQLRTSLLHFNGGLFAKPSALPLTRDQLDLLIEAAATGMHHVLEKVRAGQPLTGKEQTIHEQGLVSVLRQIHDELDTAVAETYGWPVDLSDEQILERLVALNHQRADEERRGLIRWLRPEFQNPDGRTQQVIAAEAAETPAKARKPEVQKFRRMGSPTALIKALRAGLSSQVAAA